MPDRRRPSRTLRFARFASVWRSGDYVVTLERDGGQHERVYLVQRGDVVLGRFPSWKRATLCASDDAWSKTAFGPL